MKIFKGLIFCFACMLLITCKKNETETAEKTGTVKVTIRNTVKGNPMLLFTGNYTNGFGEQYKITKFKYYLSNVSVTGSPVNPVNVSYYLIDESNPASLSFSFQAPVKIYSAISFTLGVDSARNVSGAQTGALDPVNDMFWTWNSGYIMAKMEGNSPQSTAVNNKVEYHIGGFSGSNSIVKSIGFLFFASSPLLDVREGKTSEIFFEADF